MIYCRTTKEAILPLSEPMKCKDGLGASEIFIPKDSNMIIGILGANTDTATWGPDALEWKPERWLSSLPDSVVDAHMPGVYSHMWVIYRHERRAFRTDVLYLHDTG